MKGVQEKLKSHAAMRKHHHDTLAGEARGPEDDDAIVPAFWGS